MQAPRNPVVQPRLGVVEGDAGDADLLKAEFGTPAPDLYCELPEVHAELCTRPWKGDQYNHPHV